MACEQSLKVMAYLDGELDAAAALEVERHLESCAECWAEKGRQQDLKDALFGVSYHSAPPSLRHAITRRLDSETRPAPGHGFWWGAGSGAGAMALAASLVFILLQPGDPLVNDLIEAHQRSLLGNHLIDVVSSDRHTVKPWFAGHADVSPPAPNFAAQGYALVGGRADYVDGARAAVVVYRHGAHVLNLFSWADRGQSLPHVRMRDGYRMVFWKQGDLDFAAVSDVGPQELDAFVTLMKKNSGQE